MKKNFLDKIIDIKFFYFLVFFLTMIGIIKRNIPSREEILKMEIAKYEDLRGEHYNEKIDALNEEEAHLKGVEADYPTESLFKNVKTVYKNGNDFCIVKKAGTRNSYVYDMQVDDKKILSYDARIYRRYYEKISSGNLFCPKAEIEIYNTNTKKVEKRVDVIAEVKRILGGNENFQRNITKVEGYESLSQEDKAAILVEKSFENPIICTDKSGKRIMVFEIPKQEDYKTRDSFEYLAYYIDEEQMKMISYDELPNQIKETELKYDADDRVLSALKNETQERNSYCLKNYMDRASFETLLDSNKIKYRATYLSDVAKTPVHIKMLGSDLDKSSKLAKKFPEFAKKYASDDYVIDWYAGDEKNSDEIAKQLLPEGKKLNYDTVHVGDDCAKNLKNASVDSLKDYYKKVKPECVVQGMKY